MNPAEWGTPATVIAVLTLLGLGNLAPKAAGLIWRGITGGAKRARDENDRLRVENDIESTHRRLLQEALSATRIVALNHGVRVEDLPEVPGRPARPHR
ncbi:MAG: hypothetical protein P0Y60_14430 [Candidatus Microbacterium colombiense]|nr:MAG: hypothetical protein P0Y60_14430 [Microbacterium sp.]